MRICFVTTSYPRFAGDLAGHFVEKLAHHIASGGHGQVVVLAPDAPDRGEADDPSVPVRWVTYFRPRRLQRLAYGQGMPWNLAHSPWAWANIPGFFAAFAAAVARHAAEADIVHAHWGIPGTLAVLTRPIHRRPVVVTVHGSDLRSRMTPIRWLTRCAIRRADAVLGVSPDFAETCRRIAPQRRRILWAPNGVDFPDERRLREMRQAARPAAGPSDRSALPGPRVVTVGRLIPERRHRLLLKSFAKLRTRFLSATLTVVGDGPEMDVLRRTVGDLGLGDSVRLVGNVPTQEVSGYLAAADFYVSPTTVESFGVAVAEAAAHALPVVATRVGFPATFVLDGRTGFVVPPDDAEALAAAMLRLAETSGAARESMGWAMRARAEEQGLTWPARARHAAAVYRDCLADRGSSDAVVPESEIRNPQSAMARSPTPSGAPRDIIA